MDIEDVEFAGEFEETSEAFAVAWCDFIAEIFGEIAAGKIARPAVFSGVSVEDFIGHGGAVLLCAGE